jgi:cell division protein ZapA
MSEVRGVDVNILGREFKVSCTEDEREGLMTSVHYLDKKMREIRDTGKVIGIERIAIMTALNLAHELLNTRTEGVDVGDMRRRINAMHEHIDVAIAEQNRLF